MYNFVSAATLHVFLLNFTPLKTPVVMTIPFKREFSQRALDWMSRLRVVCVPQLARDV